MSEDIFSYNRDVKTNQLVTSEFAVLKMDGFDGGGVVSLIQNCNVQYAHKVNARYEGGSTTLFWQTGQSNGNLSFSRLVGSTGFFEGLNGTCGGELAQLSVGLKKGDACSSISASGGFTFISAILQSYTLSWNVGNLDVQEGGTAMLAHMKKT